MKKFFISIFLMTIISCALHAQLAVVKMVGKNADKSKLGFGAFGFWDVPLNDIGNRSLRIELFDLAYFPPKNSDINSTLGYISVKAGYRFIFSAETKTGLFIEPSAGYCRVV